MNIRVRFSKYGFLKFIGHLDVMRYFQKAIRRADIDILYSEGYSPHQIMSFASPLGLGITSEGEYMDIAVGQTDSSVESIRRLNAQMAEGIEILSYRQLPEKSTNAMASVAAADYVVDFREEYRPEGDWQQDFLAFCGNPAILYEKETKKGRDVYKRQAQKFADDDSILAVGGSCLSSCTLAMVPIIDDAGLPDLVVS